MTKQSEVIDDPKYIPLLDHGFVGLVDHLGSDAAIVQAARVSYGAGTKTVMEDRGLIRYLMRHKHTSPIEMCEVKLHIKIPVFIMRQLVRHRTASLNEYSGRYSVMTDEFYLPDPSVIMPQSKDNKQGRAGEMNEFNATGVRWMMNTAYETNYDIYRVLLGEGRDEENVLYDPYSEEDPLFDENYNGIAREMARSVLPVGNYTELYWKQDLHNMMHLLKLRMDSHAQYEIRVLADAIYKLIQPLFPAALEAFEDYVRQAETLSRMEVDLIKKLISKVPKTVYKSAWGKELGISPRELREFEQKWAISEVTSEAEPAPPSKKTVVKKKKTSAKRKNRTTSTVRKPKPKPSAATLLNSVAGEANATPLPLPPKTPLYLVDKDSPPGGPLYAADGSAMGWVGDEWLPVGQPPEAVRPKAPHKK